MIPDNIAASMRASFVTFLSSTTAIDCLTCQHSAVAYYLVHRTVQPEPLMRELKPHNRTDEYCSGYPDKFNCVDHRQFLLNPEVSRVQATKLWFLLTTETYRVYLTRALPLFSPQSTLICMIWQDHISHVLESTKAFTSHSGKGASEDGTASHSNLDPLASPGSGPLPK